MSQSPAFVVAGTTATVALSSLFPHIDASALIGALAGGALYVTNAKELPRWQRVVHLVISAAAGYLAAPEVVALTPLHSASGAAFLTGALAVKMTTQLMERVQGFDLSAIFKKPGA